MPASHCKEPFSSKGLTPRNFSKTRVSRGSPDGGRVVSCSRRLNEGISGHRRGFITGDEGASLLLWMGCGVVGATGGGTLLLWPRLLPVENGGIFLGHQEMPRCAQILLSGPHWLKSLTVLSGRRSPAFLCADAIWIKACYSITCISLTAGCHATSGMHQVMSKISFSGRQQWAVGSSLAMPISL